ncbi:MAG: asparagine synthase (glutamine-hydrolyzing) [Elusimicrobia bacterium RIFOXYB2_FULL_62_6]|nr:MAG: asparagine synthase (glutamine-hydrolyzing) [Elusimicrobia bacterium RIFOXYB2_FULL_62_6]
MCGICGQYNYATGAGVSREDLEKMNGLIVHRGPDDCGFYQSGGVGLAMRRLSIIDLSSGHQPMSNEDGSIWIVFNGEIYNFPELRDDLLAKGHKFKTKSDTETIVHLYEEKGLDFPKYLRGMFAVAIWDSVKKRLVLARDRVGKKPLFYAVNGSSIAFASELRPLTTVSWFKRDLDMAAVDAFLTLQYIPSPISIYKNVRKLEPASVMVVEDGAVRTQKYWDLPLSAEKLGYLPTDEIKKRLYDELLEATKIRLISEVPLGAFLSGGIDSSIITALMARSSAEPVKTFSIGFKEAEFSETDYARQVAKMYGTKHTEFIVEANMADVLEKLVAHYGEPYADASALPSYFVSRETRKAVTVALNGDGGDECFGGYLRYMAMKIDRVWGRAPAALKKTLLNLTYLFPKKAPYNVFWRAEKFMKSSLLETLPLRYLSTVAFFGPTDKPGLFSNEFINARGGSADYAEKYITELFKIPAGQDLLNKLIYVDFHSYLPECLMTKMDIASMANSLETRSPFLDQKVIEFAYTLPGSMKLKGVNGTKWILKETFKDMLPPEIYKRGKMGFGIPLGPWFKGELKDRWAGTCLSEKALSRGYFNPDYLHKMWDEHQNGLRDHGYHLWALLMLEMWHNQFADDFKL